MGRGQRKGGCIGRETEKETLLLVEPDNFMNNSGKSIVSFVKNKKQAAQTVVIYDDLDLPVGTFKISFNRGSGGHRGLDLSFALKTREFVRIRVGISPTTPSGKLKKAIRGERSHSLHYGLVFSQRPRNAEKVSKKSPKRSQSSSSPAANA